MSPPLLVAQGLSRSFPGGGGVREVSLQLAAGQVLGLIGPNGGGKSTLLLLFAGLLLPDEGSVRVEGEPAAELASRAAGRVGLITARPGLYPLLTGRENLVFFGGLFGLEAAEVERRARPFLEELALLPALDTRVGAYSSGMQQKLSLARALLMDPVLLLLDEPTANLDPQSAWHIHCLLRQRADRGLGVVLATHDLHAAEGICDRVVLVRGGIAGSMELERNGTLPPASLLLDLWEGP